jgi:Skp family chaperone for outer membrane proteins
MSRKTVFAARSAEVSKSRLSLVVAGSVLAGGFLVLILSIVPAAGQQPGYPPRSAGSAPQAAPSIAVIDIPKIFKSHLGFMQQIKAMDADVKRAEETFKAKKADLQAKAAELKDVRQGTPEYNQREKDLATMQSEMQVEAQLQQKQFMQREAGIYYSAFLEVQAEVDAVAAANGLAAVLKFNGEPPNVQDPKAILQALNADVVWHDQRLDITAIVLERINAKYATPNANARRDVGVPPRQR